MADFDQLHDNLSEQIAEISKLENERFTMCYEWLVCYMPPAFFVEIDQQHITLIVHNLMSLNKQNDFIIVHSIGAAITLCFNSTDVDVRILHNFPKYGVKNYCTYISKETLPLTGLSEHLHIAIIDFVENTHDDMTIITNELKQQIKELLLRAARITDQQFEQLLSKIDFRFLMRFASEMIALIIHLLLKSQQHDSCQYDVRYAEQLLGRESGPMHITIVWHNTPQRNFLYRLAKLFFRHGLTIMHMHATYTDRYDRQSTLIMVIDVCGHNGQAVWNVADIPNLLHELITLKYFQDGDNIEQYLINANIISGNMGNLLRAIILFIHQSLAYIDSNLYSMQNIECDLCRYPTITHQLCEIFKMRFDPNIHNIERYVEIRKLFLIECAQINTGQESSNYRCKTVFDQSLNFVDHCLKTNFYQNNYAALSFRLDPQYLTHLPDGYTNIFTPLPYAIFFICGMDFFGFHIRFTDLARGGLRTIYLEQVDQMFAEYSRIFIECYHLAYTQHKKNKEIPEGGAKGILFLYPHIQISEELSIIERELLWQGKDPIAIKEQKVIFAHEKKLEALYQSQRAFIDSLLSIVNSDTNGKVYIEGTVDYYQKPEYLYLGPDENMHDCMIEWIANFSKQQHYQPGGAFISSKIGAGINHKKYGVTSHGIHVYLKQILEYLQIDPLKDNFTVKMSGGPDGDVAGNQLLNLYRDYPKTAKVIALTDGTGSVRDDCGIDLECIHDLFHQSKGIAFYPPDKLSPDGCLVNKNVKRQLSANVQETLCYHATESEIIEEWLSDSGLQHVLQANLYSAMADIFIPAGGRPGTLNANNIHEFLDSSGCPTARVIIEGANLYLTPQARHILEQKGTLIIKDSSANKGGVICSSFEVLYGLAYSDAEFIANKHIIVKEIVERIEECVGHEVTLLLHTHKQTGKTITSISDRLSDQINRYKTQLYASLDSFPFTYDLYNPIVHCFLRYCPPSLRMHFTNELLQKISITHIKACVACYLASQIVYENGVDWSPSISEMLPLLLNTHLTHKIQE